MFNRPLHLIPPSCPGQGKSTALRCNAVVPSRFSGDCGRLRDGITCVEIRFRDAVRLCIHQVLTEVDKPWDVRLTSASGYPRSLFPFYRFGPRVPFFLVLTRAISNLLLYVLLFAATAVVVRSLHGAHGDSCLQR